jgi:peptide/nickel transport system substrate-binding protein
MGSKKRIIFGMILFAGSILFAACEAETREIEVTRLVTQEETVVEKETVVQTVVQKETVVRKETIVQTVVSKPTAPPPDDRRDALVVCQGREPGTLYIYGTRTLAAANIQQGIYDGPIDNRNFGYQPVILEKLPSLEDGDAILETGTVHAGDRVVNDAGDPVTLEAGMTVRPAGCRSPDCAVPFAGEPVEMDQLVVTFKLKDGILWSDGEPLTAYDSLYAFDLYTDPDTPNVSRYLVDRTTSYAAVDDLTNVWTGLPGYMESTYFTNFFSPLPEHAWSDLTASELVESERASRTPLGWGPYVVDEWVAGDHLTMRRNDLYYRADEGLPRFDTVIFRFVGENPNANLAALLAGECDILDPSGGLAGPDLLLPLQAAGKVNATFVTGTVWEHVDFGINPVQGYERPDFFQDVRVRRAIAHCMDRQGVVDTVLYGQSVVLDTYLPPAHPLYNPDVASYLFDVEKGSALLEKVGWIDDDGDPGTPRVAQGIEGVPDGTLLEFDYWTTGAPVRQQVSQVLQGSMAQCGIRVNLEYWDATEYFAGGPEGPLFGRHFDIAQFAWLTGVEPPCDLYHGEQIPSEDNGWSGQNDPGFSDNAYDAACDAAVQSLPGEPGYETNHLEAQRIFAEQLPVVPLYLLTKGVVTRPDIISVIVDPTEESVFWNIEAFDIGTP